MYTLQQHQAPKKVQTQQQMTGSQNLGSGLKKNNLVFNDFQVPDIIFGMFQRLTHPKALNVRYIYLHLFILYGKCWQIFPYYLSVWDQVPTMASFGLSQALLPTGYLMARSVYHWPLGQTKRIGNAGDGEKCRCFL